MDKVYEIYNKSWIHKTKTHLSKFIRNYFDSSYLTQEGIIKQIHENFHLL